MTAHRIENQEGEKHQDTDIIRSTFRVVLQRSVLVFFIDGLLHSAIFYCLGDSLWRWMGAVALCNVPLYYLIGQRRSFPVYLTGVLLLLALVMTYFTHVSLHVGNSAGYQYGLLVVIPIVMVAGRIGLLVKWVLVTGLTLYLFGLDLMAAAVVPVTVFTSLAIDGLHALNLAIVSIVLAITMQRYSMTVNEYQGVIQRQATTDPLTGLLNRRRLMEIADKAVAKARRFQTPLSVIMCDVDFFKLINDQYGHSTGDAVLLQVSKLLHVLAREYDSVCRWGGEEFLLLLPETALESAGTIANRILQKLATTPIDIGTGVLNITVTLGVAELEATELLADTVQRADDALYIGKSSGRNQAVLSRHASCKTHLEKTGN